ncbi:MAG TPA: molybdopterin-dependent oxidoreductase [Bacillales bacterium]|nr:molybdopterin-dependent oxidoreductase [Bacillales bacterium]
MYKKLKKLHHLNVFLFFLLLLTGILLYWPAFRQHYPQQRIWARDVHIIIGLYLAFLLLRFLYRGLADHWDRLAKQGAVGKKANLTFIVVVTAIMTVSGIILWGQRLLPFWLNSVSLVFHDWTVIIALPFIIFHMVTRMWWVRKQRKAVGDTTYVPKTLASLPRRDVLKFGIGALIALIVGPVLYQSMKTKWSASTGKIDQLANVVRGDKNHLVPKPKPLPASRPPKGGGYEGRFRIYTVTPIPAFDNQSWDFRIDGLVKHKQHWKWQEFITLPRKVQVSDFHCVTGWSVYHVTYEGIPLTQLLKMAGVKSSATHVKFYSGDGVYTDSLTVKQAQMNDVMVAMLMDGKLIPSEFGGPVRLIVPKMYGYKSVKWLNRIELIDHDHTGYWEQRGYSKNAWLS